MLDTFAEARSRRREHLLVVRVETCVGYRRATVASYRQFAGEGVAVHHDAKGSNESCKIISRFA